MIIDIIITIRNHNTKPRREITTRNHDAKKKNLYLSIIISISYDIKNDITTVLLNICRRDFEYLSIKYYDAKQKPFISFYYYNDVIRNRD